MSRFRTEQIGDARLILGDCREVMADFPPCFRVDAVVTDPPYGIEGGRGGDAKAFKKGHYEGNGWLDDPRYITDVVNPALRIARGLSSRAAVTPGRRCAFLHDEPDDIGGFWLPASAMNGRWGFGVLDPILYYGKSPRAGIGDGPSGTIVTEPARIDGHPAAKPVSAMVWLVSKASFPGHTILDPFMGSGTTGVACANLGRKFTGIELHEPYFDIACRRIEEAYKQPRLFDEPAPKVEQGALSL